jgi:hypothetical protein
VTATVVSHPLVVTDIPNGRDLDWTHPDACPIATDECEFTRRIRRMGDHDMVDLVADRPAGTYLLGWYGFHGLCLIDENGRMLPDPPTAAQVA